jgi:DNA-binding transcriptional LysR family regulator
MLSVRRLMAFQAVMVAGTATGAAQNVRLTQPAVSNLIGTLEDEIGFKLFERAKGRLVPTKEASYFYEYVCGVLNSLRNLDQVARDIRESNAGALRVAANPGMSLGFLPRVLARFQERYPDVKLILQTRSSPKVVELLGTQQFDIGFAETPINHPLIEVETMRLRCVCVVPENHSFSGRPSIGPRDLNDEALVSVHPEHITSARLAELCADVGASPRVRIETQLFWTACLFVSEGAGVAIVDPLTAMEFQGRISIVPFEPSVHVELGILFPSNRPKSLVAMKFSQLVRKHLTNTLGGTGFSEDVVLEKHLE